MTTTTTTKNPTTADLQAMTPDQLYAYNLPMLRKIYAQVPLTDEEQQLHAAIVAEAERQRQALREMEVAEYIARAQRLALAD